MGGLRHRSDTPRPAPQSHAEPAAEENRIRNVADKRDAETDAKAEAELELPELLSVGCNQERAAKQHQSERIDRAGPRAIEQLADQRCRQPARERGKRIDRDGLGAVPAETLRDRLQKNRKTLAEPAAEHR